MPEYRIVTKIDPAPAVQGAQKVKQELAGIDAAQDQVAAGSKNLSARQTELMRAMGGSGAAAKKTETSYAGMAAALDRVLKATDAEAAATNNLNKLLADANRLHAAGAINAQQLAKVQTMVAQGAGRVTTSLAQQRAGYTQLGFQIQDITSTMALGINPMTILAQQGGQTASALSLALGRDGAAGKAATFMAGPWGSVIIASTAILGMFALKNIDTGDAVEEAVEALKKDAAETETNRKAKVEWMASVEGVRQAILDQKAALDESATALQSEAERRNIAAKANLAHEISIRRVTQAMLEQAIVEAEQLKDAEKQAEGRGRSGGTLAGREGADLLGMAVGVTEDRIAALRKSLGEQTGLVEQAEVNLNRTRVQLAFDTAKQQATAVGQVTLEYDHQLDALRAQADAQAKAGKTIDSALTSQIIALERRKQAAIEAAQAQERLNKASDGVSKFRSREQAIGIAGRELQGAGLRVGENVQFGGVHENHPGMGNAAHGRFAIDVNQGSGVTEASVPDIKAKFDALARLYQSRGYRVLWAGQVWEANGSGPTRPIPAGQLQHYDHMHIEAPGTIVGKATQSSTAAQELREQGQAATVAEQKGDFIQGVVDKAAGRGIPDTRAAKVKSDIAGVLADYQRKFHEAASPEQVAKITGAITDADAREIALHFKNAYVDPLVELQAQIGKTGLQREIAAKMDAERASLGRYLTDVEKKQIETSVLYGDQLQRQDAILRGISEPLEGYKQQISALNELLAKGLISQVGYNDQLAALQGPARDIIGKMPEDQIDPNSGLSYGDLSATLDENARYAQQQADLQNHRQMLLDMNINYDALEEAAKADHEAKLAAIGQRRTSMELMAASNLFGSLAEITAAGLGKQNALYKAMFIASKAFAIADSIIKIQQAIASATMSLPFPANLPAIATVAALGAQIISTITSTALNLAEGGIIRGPGGPRDDRIPVNASDGEFMVNAAATARNRPILEAINNGAVIDRQRRGTAERRTMEAANGNHTTLSFGDVIVQAGSATAKDAEEIGAATKRALIAVVDEHLAKESRSGGRLTRTNSSVMTG